MCRRFFDRPRTLSTAGSRHQAEPMFPARRAPTWRWRRCAVCRLSHGRRRENAIPDRRCRRTRSRIVGKSSRPPAIIDAGQRHRDILDQRGVGVGADMRFETMNPAGLPLCFTQWPSSSSLLAETMIVASTSVPVLTFIAPASSWPVISSNSDLNEDRPGNLKTPKTGRPLCLWRRTYAGIAPDHPASPECANSCCRQLIWGRARHGSDPVFTSIDVSSGPVLDGCRSAVRRKKSGTQRKRALQIRRDFSCNRMPAIEGDLRERRHDYAWSRGRFLDHELTQEASGFARIKDARHLPARGHRRPRNSAPKIGS